MTAFEIRRRTRHERARLMMCANGCPTTEYGSAEAVGIAVFLSAHDVPLCKSCVEDWGDAWEAASDGWADDGVELEMAA